ncbi:hypothetical protein PNBC_10360 [Paenibacillus crassostreae]|uniref:DUF3939 domain-containing protein n=1 Tax=Paenibacillus crassostreae TaxID=1763538 RepID=A0A167DXL4_9BACL|nr:hypothetical protein PNBC_10360 [Paenibacillus crassostreae]
MTPNSKNKQKTWLKLGIAVMILMLATTGCLYPEENKEQISYRESVNRIQSAVDAYQKDLEILPILNADQDIPRYEKFRVDMDALKKYGYIDDMPHTAFEKGGSAYFIIINEESDPTVRVMDLVTVQKVNDVQQAVSKYQREHDNQLPLGVELYPNIYSIDLQKAGVPSIRLASIFTNEDVTFMMDSEGIVYVDYGYDIMQTIDLNDLNPQSNEDLREYLVNHSYFVPVKSLPYTWNNGAPVATTQLLK